MKIYIIPPSMTMIEDKYLGIFNNIVVQQLLKYGVDFFEISNENIQRACAELSNEAIVIVYNADIINEHSKNKVQTFLKKANEKKVEIWPVAIDRSSREPMEIINEKQSYDVWEQLRCRNLGNEYISTIAKIFTRKIIARTFPTCYCETGEIFLSHRRIDGEEITARIYDKMRIQAKESNPFRDVVNVKVGDKAQKVIDKEMEKSDVFVFLHTCKSAESDWILKELRCALLRNIPILWIQIDDADIKELKIKPSDEPHLKYKSEDFSDDEQLIKIVDLILQRAFELVWDRANQILDYVKAIENIFEEKINVIDKRKMIYHISMERRGYHYPQRNIEQYYQIFGRTPTLEDARNLKKDLQNEDIDSMVILSNKVVSSSIKEGVVFDAAQDFCYHWNKYMKQEKEGEEKMEIVISGAFPDCDEIYKQSLTDALILFSKVIIKNGYKLTFGAHPTFQELFFEIAKETEPSDYRRKINMYISQWFLEIEPEKEKEYIKNCILHKVEKKSDMQLSLTEMRRSMIQRENVKALVCLGGKVKSNKLEEGIREEIMIAREKQIPVFVVGSVGGCSAEVASECKKVGWDKLNNAPVEMNEKFLGDINYFEMAQEMIQFLNFREQEGKTVK